MTGSVARRVVVSGRVQGVGFRWATMAEGRRRGVTGWVRNLAGGDVEAFVQGDEHAVAGMLGWLREGPSSARVWRCIVDDAEPDPSSAGFEIRR